MVTLYDVPTEDLIRAVAERLEDEIEEPAWAQFTKTGSGRELPPQQDDFWYVRAASLLRKIATDGPTGVDRLSTEYGSKKRGTSRYRVAKARGSNGSKKIIRVILQQLEEVGYVQSVKGEGRRITPEGQSFLDSVAGDVLDELDRPELERYA